jgi:hypothetical protein
MATFTIEFTVADEHMDRIRHALRKQFGPVSEAVTDAGTGEQTIVTRDMTGEELLARIRKFSIDNIKTIVMAVEAEEAAQAARDAVTAVVVE